MMHEVKEDTVPLIRENGRLKHQHRHKILLDKDGTKSQTICHRVTHDRRYRLKFFRTIAIWFTYFTIGWVIAQVGPAFPDLRLLTGTSLQTGSLLFSLGSLGYLVGCFIGSVLYDKCNTSLVMFGACFIMAVASGLFPWSPLFPVMLVIRVVAMVCLAVIDVGGNTDMLTMWKTEARSFFQALHFMFAVGGTVSPIVTQFFLGPSQESIESSTNATMTTSTSDEHILPMSETERPVVNASDLSASLLMNGSSGNEVIENETMVQYSFILTAAICVCTSIPFITMYIQEKCDPTTREVNQQISINDHVYPVLSRKKKALYLFLMAMLFLIYTAVEDSFEQYLVTFCIAELEWTKSDASLLTSAFWGTFGACRFVAIFATPYMDPAKSMIAFYVCTVISFTGLLISSSLRIIPLIWVSVCCIGLSVATLFPTQFTWIQEELMSVSGRVASLMMVCASCGTFLNPQLLGYLMDNVAPMWFNYLLLGECVMCLIVILFVFAMVSFDKKSIKQVTNNNREYRKRHGTRKKIKSHSVDYGTMRQTLL